MPPAEEVPDKPARTPTPLWPGDSGIEAREPRNLALLALHQIVFRIGWVFKTESVIVPAFVDLVTGGAGWVRGFLPVLNRMGQSVPPVFAAEWVKGLRYKKRALVAFTMLMSVPFAVLAAVWLAMGGRPRAWLAWLFLGLYFVFFALNGMYHVSFGTVQGKLIRPTRRGRLLLISTFWGALPATVVVVWLLPGWLQQPMPGWGYAFAMVSVCFVLSGLTVLLLFEPPDAAPEPAARRRGSLAEMLGTLRRDANLRRLVIVAALFAAGMIVFPHYQALGKGPLGLTAVVHLVIWVAVQNISVSVFSLIAGPLADRRGNRLALRLGLYGSALAPALAVVLAHLPVGVGHGLFWLVYVPLGLTPLVLRTLLNYALEICDPGEHPRYLSTVTLGLAVPFVLSPLVGWLVDVIGFEPVFLATALLVAASASMTFTLDEPRHRVGPLPPEAVARGTDE